MVNFRHSAVPTPHQQAADTRHSVWLSAHAGSGKTKALVDRVLRLLLEGVDAGAIYCLTYTRAAATEMQMRLRRTLKGWVRMPEAELSEALAALLQRPPQPGEISAARGLLLRLLDHPEGLQMHTIHSFCQSLLRRFPLEAGVHPGFQVAQERERQELLDTARQALYGQAAGEMPDLAAALARMAAHYGDGSIGEMLRAIIDEQTLFYTLLTPEGGGQRLRQGIYAALNCPLDLTEEAVIAEFTAGEPPPETLRQAATLLAGGGKTDAQAAARLLGWCDGPRDASAFTAYSTAYLTAEGEPRTRLCVAALAKAHPWLLEMLTAQQARVMDASERLTALRTARFSVAVASLADALLQLYAQEKQRRGLLDYDDLLFYALRLLAQPGMCEWVLTRLDADIAHLLIDEAQDTSPLQWALTRLLVEELFLPGEGRRTLFVVGDAKQSIYRFQDADPDGFLTQRAYYQSWFEASGQAFKSLSLTTSFRSTRAVLGLVDAVCALPEMEAGLKEQQVCHLAHRAEGQGKVEIWPLVETSAQPVPAPWEVTEPLRGASAAAQLAQQIACTIRRWLDEGRVLAAKGRAVRAGDIMILLRRRHPLQQSLLAALRRAGVPVAGADRIRLTAHLGVQDVLSLADWCLLPEDDLALACVLKGPWFGWDEEALFALAYDRGEASLGSRLTGETRAALEGIRSLACGHSPFDWLQHLFETLRGRHLLKERFGAEADELCDELLAQALACEAVHPPHLAYFLHWLRAGDGEIRREPEQAQDAVRVLTVHGAKGLQAPVVILPDTTQSGRGRDLLWWDSEGGQIICLAQPAGERTPPRLAELKERQRQEERAESMRQLYVALTRAEDELYVTGLKPASEPRPDCWYRLVEKALSAGL